VTRRQRTDDLTTFALPGQPALSPDGTEVVYVLTTVDAAADQNVRSLWRAPVPAAAGGGGDAQETPAGVPENANEPAHGAGTDSRGAGRGEARQLTRGTADTAPAWSPDGTRIAFLRADGGAAQVWLLPRDGGEPEQVTSLPLGVGAPVWSPDGTKIAFGAPVDPRAVPGEDDAARAKRATAPLVTDRPEEPRAVGLVVEPVRKHLHVLDVASGQVRQVTKGDWHASDPVWSPDSAKLAFGAATAPDADLNLRAPVYVIDVSGMADDVPELVLTALATGFGAPVAWAPDGDALLVVGATGEKGLTGHTRLFRVPLPAGTAADPHHDRGSTLESARTAEPVHPIHPDLPPADSGRSDDRGSSAANIAAFDPRSFPEPVDLAGALDRNVMPGGPGYPGGMPQFTDGGDTVLFCVRDRGCSHVYAVPADGSAAPRPVVTGAGRVVSGLSVADGTAAVVLATPTSFGEVVAIDLASEVEGVLTAHGSFNGPGTAGGGTRGDVDLFVRQEREFAISDGAVVQGWLVRDPSVSGPGPVLLDVHGGPHNAWNGAADAAHLYHQELAARGWTVLILNPRASDGYGEAFYTATTGGWGTSDARVSVATARGMCAAMSPLTRVGDATTPMLVLHSVADLSYHVGQALRWFTTLREQGLSARLVLYRSLSLSDSRHRPAGGRERSSAAWSGRCSRRPVAVFRHRAVAAAKPSGDLPSLARIWRGGVQATLRGKQ